MNDTQDNEQENDPNLQSFLTPYSPSFYLLDKEASKNKSLKTLMEESLNENIDQIKIKKDENVSKKEINSTESEEKSKDNIDNNKLNNIDNNNNIQQNLKKEPINEKTPDNINNDNDIENKRKSTDDSSNEPLKYKSSSLEKDIRSFYKFKDFLGEGHFGSVRSAFKKREYSPHKFFAVKSISLKKLSEKDYKNLILEVKIISSLEHPHIVKFYETFYDKKYFHIVIELCRGNNLYQRLKKLKGKMKEEHAKIIIFKVLHAINYCHSNGVVHRDLKPENIVFESPSNNQDNDGYDEEENKDNYFNIKICDFGLSALKNNTDKLHTILGTPY